MKKRCRPGNWTDAMPRSSSICRSILPFIEYFVPDKRKEKAVRYLAGHGFSASAAFSVWERFLHDPEGNG